MPILESFLFKNITGIINVPPLIENAPHPPQYARRSGEEAIQNQTRRKKAEHKNERQRPFDPSSPSRRFCSPLSTPEVQKRRRAPLKRERERERAKKAIYLGTILSKSPRGERVEKLGKGWGTKCTKSCKEEKEGARKNRLHGRYLYATTPQRKKREGSI